MRHLENLKPGRSVKFLYYIAQAVLESRRFSRSIQTRPTLAKRFSYTNQVCMSREAILNAQGFIPIALVIVPIFILDVRKQVLVSRSQFFLRESLLREIISRGIPYHRPLQQRKKCFTRYIHLLLRLAKCLQLTPIIVDHLCGSHPKGGAQRL